MVGPESEAQGALRHMCRMLTLGCSMTVPTFCVVTRKAYGLGAQARRAVTPVAPSSAKVASHARVPCRAIPCVLEGNSAGNVCLFFVVKALPFLYSHRQAMGGGSHHAPTFTVSWPTGEFGGMGLEGAVKLGMRKELLAERDLTARRALFDDLVAKAYDSGKALQCARARALPHANFFFFSLV